MLKWLLTPLASLTIKIPTTANSLELTPIRLYYAQFYRLLKTLRLANRQRIAQLPQVLLLGPSQAGRTQLLAHSNLTYYFTQELVQLTPPGMKTCGHANGWVTDWAVYLDTPGWYFEPQTTTGLVAWQQLLRCLNPSQLSSCLLTFDITQLTDAADLAKQWQVRLYELAERCRRGFSIYLVFTQLDRIIGFTEFFEDLGQEERQQAFGWEFSTEISPDSFEESFQALLQRLQERLIWRLQQEQDPAKKAKIINFPWQLESILPQLLAFAYSLSELSRIYPHIKIAGCYFGASPTDTTLINPLQTALNHLIPMTNPQPIIAQPITRHLPSAYYFTPGLLKACLKPWLKPTPYPVGPINRKSWLRYGLSTLLCLGIFSLALWYHYHQVHQQLHSIQWLLQQANTAQPDLQLPSDLQHLLPRLNALATAKHLLQHPQGSNHRLIKPVDAAYQRLLQQQFAPWLAQYLHQQLAKPSTDPEFLYSSLKAYLMLGDTHHLQADTLQLWLQQSWQLHYPQQAHLVSQLLQHLKAALTYGLAPLSLDTSIIHQARNSFKLLPEPLLAYAILQSESTSPRYAPLSQLLPEQQQIWQNPTLTIPGRYTAAFYHQQLPAAINQAIRVISQGDWVLNNSPHSATSQSLASTLKALYIDDYNQTWQHFLEQLQPQAWTQLNLAQHLTQDLSTNPDSLLAPLQIAATELQALATNQRSNFSQSVIQFQKAQRKTVSSQLQQRFKQLQQFFKQLSQPDAAWHYSEQWFQGKLNAKDAISNLAQPFPQAPACLTTWQQMLANSSLSLVFNQTVENLNQQWQTTVFSYYQKHIQQHFPFTPTAATAVTLEEFEHFFGPQGLLSNFFNHKLQPFVDTQQTLWQAKVVNHVSLPITEAALQQLERAHIIRSMFYSDSKALNVKFQLQINPLNDAINQVKFTLNGQTFSDDQSSQLVHSLTWPGPKPQQGMQWEVMMANGKKLTWQLPGPWGWFKLLQQAQLEAVAGNTQQYLLTVNIKGQTLSYNLTADQAINPFVPKIIEAFSLPKQLTISN